jgi:hypothetical protein
MTWRNRGDRGRRRLRERLLDPSREPFTFDTCVGEASTGLVVRVDAAMAHDDPPVEQGAGTITSLATVPVSAALPLSGTAVAGLAIRPHSGRA